jgi:putative redox protein
MNVCVKWLDHMSFVAETDSGHAVVMDGPPNHGGRNLAPRPMELLLAGLGGCTAFDVLQILQKGKSDVTGCRVEIQAERASEPPAVFTRIHLHYVVVGRRLLEAHVKRAIQLSAEKYCSASIMLGKTAVLTHDWELLEA